MKIIIKESQLDKVIDNYITSVVDPIIDYKRWISAKPYSFTKIDYTWFCKNDSDKVFAKYYLKTDGESTFFFTSHLVEQSLRDVLHLSNDKIIESIRSWAMKHLGIKNYIKGIMIF